MAPITVVRKYNHGYSQVINNLYTLNFRFKEMQVN